MSSYYLQTTNIDASNSINLNEGMGFNPIGVYTTTPAINAPFTGQYNGAGFSISNLYINKPTYDYIGMFGLAKSLSDALRCKLININLINANITGQSYVGALVGKGSGLIIDNCTTSGTITSPISKIGGIAGSLSSVYNYPVSTTTNSSSSCSINNSAGYGYAGGFIGLFDPYSGTISNCTSSGDISVCTTTS